MAIKLKASPSFLSVLDPDLYTVGTDRVKAFAKNHDAHVTAGVAAALLEHGPVAAIEKRIKQYIDTMDRDDR